MGKILKGFSSALPRLQAREIEKELQSQEQQLILGGDSNQIRAELQRQLREVLDSDTFLRFRQIDLRENDWRESEAINWMLDKITGDITSLFAESDQLAKVQRATKQFMQNDIVEKLEYRLNELENEIERLELISGRFNGLSDAVAENFRTDGQRLNRTDPIAHLAIVDPKGQAGLTPDQEMHVDTSLGGLTLPASNYRTVRPMQIREVLSSDTTEGEEFSSLTGFYPSSSGAVTESGRIENLIDGSAYSVWTKKTKAKPTESGAHLSFILDFSPGPATINYIELAPVGGKTYRLVSLTYLSESNVPETIDIAGDFDFSGKIAIPLRTIKVRKIGVVLAQLDYTADFGESSTVVNYEFSFAGINVGMLEYQPIGYYVTRTITQPLISKLYLSTQENQTAMSEEVADADPRPTIEYWVAYREIDEAENILTNRYIPILPIEADRVFEKIRVRQNDQSTLMFKVDETMLADSENLRLFQNGTELLRPVDYDFDVAEATFAEGTILNIRNGFNVDNEYIAYYEPLHQNLELAPLPFLDRTGLIELLEDNSVKIVRGQNSRAIRSEVNLIVIMRGTADKKRTAIINRLVFGAG